MTASRLECQAASQSGCSGRGLARGLPLWLLLVADARSTSLSDNRTSSLHKVCATLFLSTIICESGFDRFTHTQKSGSEVSVEMSVEI